MTIAKTYIKTSIYCISLFSICACNNNSKQTTGVSDTTVIKTEKTQEVNTVNPADTVKSAFDVTEVPVVTNDIGTFPYLKAPDDYKFNDISKSDLKNVHFSVNGKLINIEGKTYSTNIYKLQDSETPFNSQVVQNFYDKAIKDLGGVKLSTKLLPGQVEKTGKKLLEEEGDHAYTIIGVNDYTLNHVNTYLIRTPKAEVWIELSFYETGGYLYILEKENGWIKYNKNHIK